MLKALGWLQHFSAVAVQRLLHLMRSVVTSVLCTDLPYISQGMVLSVQECLRP